MNRSTLGYTAIVILLSVTGLFSFNLFLRQRTDCDLFDVHTFPHTIGEWRGEDLEISEKEYRILETKNLISRVYSNDAQEEIHLFIIYSETNRSVFHPPEVCLIGSGLNITDKRPEEINTKDSVFNCSKLYIERGNTKHLSLYCYKSGNFYTDNYYLQQAAFAFNQLFGRHRGGATIRVSMLLGEDEEKTLRILKSFMKEMIVSLERLS